MMGEEGKFLHGSGSGKTAHRADEHNQRFLKSWLLLVKYSGNIKFVPRLG